MKKIILISRCMKNIFQSSKLLINRKISSSSLSMGKSVPDRWLDYSKIGNVVDGTSFIPFKVPLHQSICENLPETARHTTRDIIEALPNVGLVINLTNTQKRSKYYEPNDWISRGIDYKWIKVEGHVTPSQQLLVQFCHTVKQYMLSNPSKLIGIHCTHGLNRTGYFVCSYMVLMLSIPPQEAIRRFGEARGYEIERENYISSIMLHDSNFNLKLTANTLPVLMPKNAIKRNNQTEIDDERYDDRKRIHFNDGEFSKSNSRQYGRNFHGSPRGRNSYNYSRSREANDYGSRSRYYGNDNSSEINDYGSRSRYYDNGNSSLGSLSGRYQRQNNERLWQGGLEKIVGSSNHRPSRSKYSYRREYKETDRDHSSRTDNRSRERHTDNIRPSISNDRSSRKDRSPRPRRSRSKTYSNRSSQH